jgi:hypothetical protein
MYEDVSKKLLAIIRTFNDDPSTVGICLQSNRYKPVYFWFIFIYERENFVSKSFRFIIWHSKLCYDMVILKSRVHDAKRYTLFYIFARDLFLLNPNNAEILNSISNVPIYILYDICFFYNRLR